MLFCTRDLDLDPITLIYERDLDILRMYLQTKIEDSTSKLSNVRARTGQTDTPTQTDETKRIINNDDDDNNNNTS